MIEKDMYLGIDQRVSVRVTTLKGFPFPQDFLYCSDNKDFILLFKIERKVY